MIWNIPRIWEDGECWIIGGGPSICEVLNIPLDIQEGVRNGTLPYSAYSPYFEPIRDKHIIGVNNAFKLGEWVDVLFFGDISWYLRYKDELVSFHGLKVTSTGRLNSPEGQIAGIKYVERDKSKPEGISTERNKISWNRNSGASAINLAVHFGTKRIYLLGFDMSLDEQKYSHWFGRYPHKDKDRYPPFKLHLKGFPAIANDAKKLGVEIYNVSPNSKIDVFPKITLQEALNEHRTNIIVEENRDIISEATENNEDIISVVTATGDKPLAFSLCVRWMLKQTRKPDQWIVVDDGNTPIDEQDIKDIPFLTYIRREPAETRTASFLGNWREGLENCIGNKIIIVEDDEYYASRYIETMAKMLNGYEIIGITRSRYYNIASTWYKRIPNIDHASWAQTAFSARLMPDVMDLLCGNESLDLRLWKKILAENIPHKLFDDNEYLFVAIKGLPGRPGFGGAHRIKRVMDSSLKQLREWMPDIEDFNLYREIHEKLKAGKI